MPQPKTNTQTTQEPTTEKFYVIKHNRYQVWMRGKVVLYAVSKTMARRAAAALNRYQIGTRGY